MSTARNRIAADSRRADEDVESAELESTRADSGVGVARFRHVAANRKNVLVEAVGIDVEHGYACTARAQQLDGRRTDPAGASRDEGHAAAEVVRVHTQSYIAGRTERGRGLSLARGVRSDRGLPARDAAARSGPHARRARARRAHARRAPLGPVGRLGDAGDGGDARASGRGCASRPAARSLPPTSRGQPSSPVCRTRSSSRSTPRCVRTARPRTSSRAGRTGSRRDFQAVATAAFVREAARGLRSSGISFSLMSRRSRRFVERERRELRREVLITPHPELGLVAMNGPNDPEPGSRRSRTGESCGSTDGASEEFDAIDHFIARHGARSRSRGRGDGARRRRARPPARRRRRAARGARPASRGLDAGAAGARGLAARPRRADVRAQEAARPPRPGEPGARHEPEGEPGAARGRRRRGRARAVSPRSRRPSASRATRR